MKDAIYKEESQECEDYLKNILSQMIMMISIIQE
jgi:hypothetical protein